ncbi:MAG: hypothetical protein Q9165_003756 [Trypethelium subeluteriae]
MRISNLPNNNGLVLQSHNHPLDGQDTVAVHSNFKNITIISEPISNAANGRSALDGKNTMASSTVLGKRRRPAGDLGSKVTAGKLRDISSGSSSSPISTLTTNPTSATLSHENESYTIGRSVNGFEVEGMPQTKSSEESFSVFDNQFIKSTASSPKSFPHASPAGYPSGLSESLASNSPQAIDGKKTRGFPRRITKNPKPSSSIPQALSWAEYARQCSLAAYTSRLNPFALSPGEDKLLKGQIDPIQVTTYLNIRNGILRLWTRNSLVPVTTDEAFGCAKSTRHFGLVSFAYQWLFRNGYINYGCVEVPNRFAPTSRLMKSNRFRRRQIVIVGAGMSGLGCARQLEGLFAQMGDYWSSIGERLPKVVVLEARRRLGGRVYSHRLRTQITDSLPDSLPNTVELGAHIITGFEFGNPLNAIIRGQLALRYHGLRDNSELYDCDGTVVNKERDDSIQKLYNDILERVCAYRHRTTPVKTMEGNRDLMLFGRDPSTNTLEKNEKALNTKTGADVAKVASHDQMAQRDKSTQHVPGGLEKLAGKAYQVSGTGAKSSATDAAKAMGWAAKEGAIGDRSLELDSFVNGSAHPTLGTTMDEAIRQYQSIINLTHQDMRLLNWHHANLEYSNAAHVDDLSLSGWDQDTGNEFEGEHSQIIGGYLQVPRALYQLPDNLDVRFNADVAAINYDPSGDSYEKGPARITCSNGETLEADQVVLTVPLGVIKEGDMKFSPPLPEWKIGAIERLGFGLLNKVVLVYEEAFWDEDQDMFGLLNQSQVDGSINPQDYSARRGRFYLFWNCVKTSGRPVLIALMAGQAAYDTESTENHELIREVTDRLSRNFSPKPVPEPSEVIVTRWRKDPWARGTYSYVGPKSLPGDYDVMAKPVGNLHFAGEATCGTHPATVHGAYLSGLRAAAEVVESMIGPISVPQPLIHEPTKAEMTPSGSASKPRGAAKAVPTAPAQAAVPSGTVDRGDPEATILEAIFQQIGERPLKPIKEGTNPFLLYTKDKWTECKTACDEKKRNSPKNSSGKASKDEVRIALGKMWRQASNEEKKPYQEHAEIRKQMTTAWMAEWKQKIEEWDREAARIREQFTDSKPQFGDQGAQLRAHLDAAARGGSNGAV